MTYKGYSCGIHAWLLGRPLGEDKYYAKLSWIFKGTKEISLDLGEVWGKTEKEAEEKMEQKVKEWIDKQSRKST